MMWTLLFSIVFCAVCAGPALAEASEGADPLAPCLAGKSPPEDVQTPGPGWGIELASSFKRQDALDKFAAVQKKYSDLLRDYDPSVFASCDLSLGTDLRYSVRIAFDGRNAADELCSKLQSVGGACIVTKN